MAIGFEEGPAHFLCVPDNPCFHQSDCHCDRYESSVYVVHNLECPKIELGRFFSQGDEIVWEEFNCEIGKIIYRTGLESHFRHYLDPSWAIDPPPPATVTAMFPGKYRIEVWDDGKRDTIYIDSCYVGEVSVRARNGYAFKALKLKDYFNIA